MAMPLSAVRIALVLGLVSGLARADDAPAGERQHPPYVLSRLNKEGLPSLLADVKTADDWQAKCDAIRRVWMSYVGELPPRPPAKYRVLAETEMEDHVRQKIVYDTVYNDRITAYLLIPNQAKGGGRTHPAVLALHPTNAEGKDSVATPEGRKNRTYGYELVRRGYVVLAPDAMTSGERIFEGLAHFRDAPFYRRHPNWSTVGKNLVDHMQGVDLLADHPLVDPQRIGAIGHSFGAYNAYFLAGADPRIRAYVSSCGFSPFTGSTDARHWGIRDWYTHLPKVQKDLDQDRVPFEFHEIVALTAPIPAFFYAGQRDHIFPHWKSIGEGMAQVHDLYAFLKAEERFTSMIGAGGHDFPPPVRNMAYDFLDQWLKGKN